MKRARSFSLAGAIRMDIGNYPFGARNYSSGTIMPVFSARKDSVTPVTFTQALGYGQSEGVTGDPASGFTVLWASGGKVADVASVIACVGNSIHHLYGPLSMVA